MRMIVTLFLVAGIIVTMTPVAGAEQTLLLTANHSRLLKVNSVQRVTVAAPDIADVNVISRSEVMVIAKKPGETIISIWDAGGLTTYRVVVLSGLSPELARAVKEALRDPGVEVRVMGDVIFLDGTVRTEADRKRAEDIAKAFGRTVVNLLRTSEPTPLAAQVKEQQIREALKTLPVTVIVANEDTVIIEGTVASESEAKRIDMIARAYFKNVVLLVRPPQARMIRLDAFVVEVDREALRQIGVEWGGGSSQTRCAAVVDGVGLGCTTSSLQLTDPFAFLFRLTTSPLALNLLQELVARLRLLEAQGVARTLANPGLVVLEGQTAKMLIGGELPIPVQTPTGVSFQFKEFGVRLEFKAVGEGDGPLTIDLKAEASSLDFSNAIVAAGFTVPSLRSRRVETMVRMRPGEFLVLGGLIQRIESRNVQKIPILGDIPILGALFRSTRFQRGETELVIFVSPSFVAPTREQPQLPATPSEP